MLSLPRLPTGQLSLVGTVLVLLVLLAAQTMASGPLLGGAVCDFERTTLSETTGEITRGTFYLSPAGAVALHVTEPVSQIMSWADSLMVIAYPLENKAFVVRHQGDWSPDLLFPSIAYQYVAQGLEGIGYDLVSYETMGETTAFHWRYPESKDAPALAASVDAKLVDGLAASMSSFDKKGDLLSRATFASYREIGELVLPMDVERTRKTGDTWISERVVLTNPVWVEALPDSILSPIATGEYEVLHYDFGEER